MPHVDDGELERVLARVDDQAEVYGTIRVERCAGDRFDLAFAASTILDAQNYRDRPTKQQ